MKRATRILAAVSLAVLALTGCRESTWRRFQAERMMWRANMAVRQLKVNPVIARDQDFEKAIGSFEAVATRFPAPAVHDTSELGDADSILLARISGRALLQAARLRSQRQQTDKAMALCDRVLRQYAFDQPMCLDAQYLKGTVLESANRIGEAIDEYEKVVEDYPPAVRSGDFPIAQVLDLPLRIGAYYQGLGDSLRAAERYERARLYYEDVMRRYPGSQTSAVARVKLGTTYANQRRYADAIRTLQGMTSEPSVTDDQKAEVLYTIGSLQEDGLKDHRSALATLSGLLRDYAKSPVASRAQLMLGAIYRGQGDVNRAIEELKKVPDRYPDDLESGSAAGFQLAQIYEARNDWDEALEQYNATAANFSQTRYGLLAPMAIAQHYRNINDAEAAGIALDRAVETYHDFIDKNGTNPLAAVAQEYVSQARLLQQKWPEAVEELSRYGDRYPQMGNAPLALLSAAQISREKLGNTDLAVQLLRKIQTRYPKSAVADQAQRQLDRIRPAS